MAPGSILYYIILPSTSYFYHCLFCNLYFPIYTTKYQKYLSYYLYQISLSQVTVKGLTTPLSRWLRGSWLFVQVLGDLCVVSYWTDTLVLKNWGEYLRYFAASPFPLQGKTNACSRGSKKDFWRRCRGDLRQVKTYQVPIINSSPSHYIICHSPLVFLSPTSKMIFENLCLFFAPLPFASFHVLLVSPCVRPFVLPSWPILLSLLILPIMKFWILNKGSEKT